MKTSRAFRWAFRRSGARRLDLFDLKGVIESIGIRELSFRRAERPELSLSADVLSGSDVIGFFGQLAAACALIVAAGAMISGAICQLDATIRRRG